MRRFITLLCVVLYYASQAHAQSSPGLINGQVPTAAQWNSYFAAKQDVLGFTPVNRAGDTMTGKFRTFASSGSQSGFAILSGTAPSSPTAGDVWMTTAGLFYQTPSLTVGPLIGSSGGTPLTNHGVVIGTGTAALAATAAMTAGQVLVGQGATADPLPRTLSQDCTLASTGVVTCLRTNNNLFTSAATTAIGTSGATIPLLNTNNTWSSTSTVFTGPTDDTAEYGPIITYSRVSTSPAANDGLARFLIQGRDSGGNATNYLDFQAQIADPTNGSEDGRIILNTIAAGASTPTLTLESGVTTAASLVATTADINGGTIDATNIGNTTRGFALFTSLAANSTVTFTAGGSMTGTWSNLGTVTTVDINGGTIDGVTIATSSIGASQLTGTVAQARLGATGTWTPADNSGAGLSFASVDARYTRVGDMVFAYASWIYPATASGANASFSGLPVTVPTGANRQCSLTYTSAVNATYVLPTTGGATTAGFFTSAGVATTNVQMSGATVFLMCIYSSV